MEALGIIVVALIGYFIGHESGKSAAREEVRRLSRTWGRP